MTQTKKLVLGTQNALYKAIDAYSAKGWEIERTEVVPRGNTGRKTYLLYLKK